MQLLLDTHTWLWALQKPESLGLRARKLLQNPSSELYLSPVSIWEASLLYRKGRLKVRSDFSHWLDNAKSAMPHRDLPISAPIMQQAVLLHLPQPGFGDTILAATTIVHNLTLLTFDEQLLNFPGLKTLSAS